jgi:hypothetical protein
VIYNAQPQDSLERAMSACGPKRGIEASPRHVALGH